MPTVILLDVSLSMCRPSSRQNTNKDTAQDPIEIRQLANVGIGALLDYLAQNAQLEYTSLLVFSSLWEIRNQFTRNHESIKSGIYELELYDKSNIVNAMRGALSLKLDEWSQNGTINIILVTDGQFHHNSRHNEQAGKNRRADDDFVDISLKELEGQFDFPCKLQIVCLTSPRDPALKHSLKFFKDLISIVDSSAEDCPVMTTSSMKHSKPSAIWLPESDSLSVSIQSVEELFTNIADLHYKPYHSVISFGHLSSMVMLSPKPTECLVEPLKNEFDDLKNEESLEETKETFVSALNKVRLFKLYDEVNICGFMSMNEIASPAVTSRHLVLPIPNNKFNEIAKAEQILSQDPNAYCKSLQTCTMSGTISSDRNGETSNHTVNEKHMGGSGGDTLSEQDITKQPSFCILLHNCLKQENMVAICIVGKSDEANEDWYGILHSHIDSRKRSSLMLSLLLPGPNPILWLPSFRSLGSISLNSEIIPSIREKSAANQAPLKSYSSNNVIWLDPESVQADVQKIVRHAKRAPDKAPHFYKELNRIRRAAISYGFYDVLSGLASILERERRIMTADNKPVSPDILKHIDHVILNLRLDLTEDSYDTQIIQMKD